MSPLSSALPPPTALGHRCSGGEGKRHRVAPDDVGCDRVVMGQAHMCPAPWIRFCLVAGGGAGPSSAAPDLSRAKGAARRSRSLGSGRMSRVRETSSAVSKGTRLSVTPIGVTVAAWLVCSSNGSAPAGRRVLLSVLAGRYPRSPVRTGGAASRPGNRWVVGLPEAPTPNRSPAGLSPEVSVIDAIRRNPASLRRPRLPVKLAFDAAQQLASGRDGGGPPSTLSGTARGTAE
jgi:hypothetical protein